MKIQKLNSKNGVLHYTEWCNYMGLSRAIHFPGETFFNHILGFLLIFLIASGQTRSECHISGMALGVPAQPSVTQHLSPKWILNFTFGQVTRASTNPPESCLMLHLSFTEMSWNRINLKYFLLAAQVTASAFLSSTSTCAATTAVKYIYL